MRRFLRKRFQVTIVALLLLVVSSYAAYRVMLDPRLVREKAQRVLSEMLGVDVKLEGASFQPFSGLYIDRIVIPSGPEPDAKPLAELHDIRISHYLASLFTGQINIREISAGSISLNLSRAADGSWNFDPIIATLRKRPPTKTLLPAVRVENVQISLHDALTIDREGRPFDVEVKGVLAAMTPRAGQHVLELALAVNDPDLGTWQVRGATVDVDTGTLKLAAESNRLPINEALVARLGARGREIMKAYGPPDGGDVKFTVFLTYEGAIPQPLWFRVEADLQGVAASSGFFPYRVEDLRGVLVFTPEGVHVDHLTGRSGPAQFSFAGDIIGFSSDAGVDVSVDIDQLRLDDKLRDALRETWRNTFVSFNPSGMLDVDVRIKRVRGPDKPTSVAINARTTRAGSEPARVTYAPFPYPVTLSGSASYVDGHIRIDPMAPLQATHGANVFYMSGSIDPGDPGTIYDLSFSSKAIKLDPELYRALPEETRRIWDYMKPDGTVAASVQLKRLRADAPAADIDVTLDNLNADFTCRDFVYPIHAGAGRIIYRRAALPAPSQSITLENLAGRHNKTDVTVSGSFTNMGREGSSAVIDLSVSARNIPLDDELRKALPESVAWMWDFLLPAPGGLVDAQCSFKRADPAVEPLEYRIQVRPTDMAINCRPFPYKVSRITGQVDFLQPNAGPDAGVGLITLTRLRGVGDSGAHVEVNGLLKGFHKGLAPDLVDLSISGADVPLDPALRSALSPAYGKTFDALGPTGKVDVFCHLDRNAAVADKLNSRVVVTARGNELRYEKFPVPLSEVTGRIEILDGNLHLSGLSGKALGGRVTLDGTINNPDERSSYDLSIHAFDIALDDKFPAILPPQYRDIVLRLNPTGRTDASVTLKKDLVPPDSSSLSYQATFALRKTSFDLEPSVPSPERAKTEPKRLTGVEGVVEFSGVINDNSEDFQGRINFVKAQLEKFALTDAVMRFKRFPDRWEFYDLDAGVLGGKVNGQMQVRRPAQPGERPSWSGFAAVLRLRDLDLARVGTELFEMRPNQVQGKLSGSVELQGTRLTIKDVIGRSELSVKEGKLWELPVILSLLNVLNIPVMDRTAFTEARANIEVYDSRFHITRLDLLGSAVSIYGKGEINPSDGDVSLTFLTGLSRLAVPDIPVVGDLLKAAQKQLMLVRVSGTVREPKLDVEPVAPVTGPIKAILADIFGPSKSPVADQLKEVPKR